MQGFNEKRLEQMRQTVEKLSKPTNTFLLFEAVSRQLESVNQGLGWNEKM